MPAQTNSSGRITRREFLIATGLTITSLAVGCKRFQSSTGEQEKLYQVTPSPVPANNPDLILRNGKVLTVDHNDTTAQAVAVKGDLIQDVGSNEVIDALKGDATQIIDLNGRVLTPGLIDPHFHLGFLILLDLMTPFLPPEVTTLAQLQKKLAGLVAQTPKGDWIQGYYLILEANRPPSKEEMDKVSPDHPVWMMHQAGHMGSANSLALKLAGITKDTQDPMGGIIERGSNGEPTGRFYNHRAMNILRDALPPRPEGAFYQSIIDGQKLMAASGITSFHDVYVYGEDTIQAYRDVGTDGKMILRGAIYPVLENPQDLDIALNMQHVQGPFLRLGGFKLQIDGQGPTFYTHEPHEGISWDMPAWDPKIYKEIMRSLHDTGLQVCVHCGGDAAVDLTLDAFEEAMQANPRPDPRHRIEHCGFSTPEAIKRIKDLGVVISDTPSFIRMSGDYWSEIFSKKMMQRCLVAREWLDAGIPLAINSDYPTTPWYTPQFSMASAMSRMTLSNKVIGPEHCLTFQEALRAQTMGAAYAGFDENSKGSIEPGKLADLAVWAEDPSSMSFKELVEAKVDLTLVGGNIVYQV